MTSTIQNGEGVEAAARALLERPYLSDVDKGRVRLLISAARQSLAREPATADVEREDYWKALEQAARDLGGAGLHLVGKRQSNLWLDIAFKAHTALSRAGQSSEPAIAEGERDNPWREAVINALIVGHIYQAKHDGDPRQALHDLICWEVDIALDSRVSSRAAALAQSSTPPASKGVESVHTKGRLVVGDNRLQAKRNTKWGPCPECGVGAPGHEGDCSHAPVAILGPREPASPTPSNDTLQGRGEALSNYDYNELWDAIAKATRIEGGIIAISVRTFRAALQKDTRHDG